MSTHGFLCKRDLGHKKAKDGCNLLAYSHPETAKEMSKRIAFICVYALMSQRLTHWPKIIPLVNMAVSLTGSFLG